MVKPFVKPHIHATAMDALSFRITNKKRGEMTILIKKSILSGGYPKIHANQNGNALFPFLTKNN